MPDGDSLLFRLDMDVAGAGGDAVTQKLIDESRD